jgi:hypothetical protein
MTGQERDYEAILSRVLHTTTDQLEPVGDGLTKIRARLSEPWLKRQWWLLRSAFMVLRWLVVVRCESLFSRIRSRSDVTDLAPGAGQEADGGPLKSLLSIATSAPAKTPGKRRGRLVGPAMAWFRPALAVAGAVVLVVAGVFALGSIRMVVGLENATGTNSSTNGQQNGNGNANGSASQFSSGASSQGNPRVSSSGSSAAHSRTLPSATPCAGASSPAQNSPSPATSPTSASPSPSPTSASPTPTPTESPSPTTSQAPITSGITGHTQEAIGTMALVMCEQIPPGGASPSNQAPIGP